jgi:long-chain acyl-CoA synthetase
MTSAICVINPASPFAADGEGEKVLITGATGFLGQQIVGVLLEKMPKARLVVLLREKKGQSIRERLNFIISQVSPPEKLEEALSRIDLFHSDDISNEMCGLSTADYNTVISGLTHIIHSAATVRFDHPIDYARQINVGGTRNVLDLAEVAHRNGTLRSVTYIGTAFVAGVRSGLALEDELDVGQTYRNTYELTKCEAEKLVRSRMHILPTVIVRPSIIAGDSRTGETTSFKTLYWPLKMYVKLHWRTIPGYPDAIIDIVPVNYVAEATVALTFDERAIGNCFNLCAGSGKASTLVEITEYASSFFSLPSPRFVNPKLFFAFVLPFMYATVWGKNRRSLREIRVYRPYFQVKTLFDTSCAEAFLAPAGISPPPVMEYLGKLFLFCQESDWGSRPVGNRNQS